MQDIPNLNYIDELAEGNIEFRQKFIDIIKEELPKEIKIYHENIANGDLRLASELVHKLKHKFNVLGMTNSYEYAVEHEEELNTNNCSMDEGFKASLLQMQAYILTI